MKLKKLERELTLRLILELIFLWKEFEKVLIGEMENVINAPFFNETFKDMLPAYLINITAYYTSYIELIGGFLLVIGFKTNYALYALASVLIIVTFAHGLVEPIWDLSHVMPRTILLVRSEERR